MRTLRIPALAALLLVVSFIAPRPATAAPERPNILVILCDDLGYGDVACFGNKTIRTPNLDRLAAQGMRLTDCYSTAPVCSSSRAGLLTGRTPSRVGVYDWIPAGHPMHLKQDEVTVAALLKDAGYSTCHVGKWHCNGKFNSDDQPQPGDAGFDHWFSTQNNASPTHHNPANFVRNGKPVGKLEGYSCGIVADEGIRWLRARRDADNPFFMFVCFHEPHEPIDSPPELVAHYSDATKNGEALYYANVENMDRAVGKLTAALADLEVDQNTLVIFTSDNGPETLDRYRGAWRSHGTPGPLRGMKLHLYEAGFRVPGILRWPARVKPGQIVGEAVCALDFLPTFCELAGAALPKDRVLDGASFLPVLEGSPVVRSTPLYWHYFKSIGKPKAAMRVGDYMILGHWDQQLLSAGSSVRAGDMELIKKAELVDFELYNLRADLAQQRDLKETEPQRFARMKVQLLRKYREVRDAGPNWDVPPKTPRKKK
ncbi:MAG: arylsulfatase [Planctomycetaceae bacterium]|nr:arylsulfatase [Planctomycetaceae bacterium]